MAQAQTHIKPLAIGDTLPADLTLTNVLNHPVSTIKLSDLRGKLVILDFWATWCGSCVEQFPKMQDLQKSFGDGLQIIMVNTEPREDKKKVLDFFEKRAARTGQHFSLPVLVQDSIFKNYFPHTSIPHYVWLKDGVVCAITGRDEVHAANATKIMDGAFKLTEKNDFRRFDVNKSFLADRSDKGNIHFLYRSILTAYQPELGTTIGKKVTEDGLVSRYFIINYSLISFLQIAYSDIFDLPLNRIVVETTEEIKEKIEKRKEFKFCYETISMPVAETALTNRLKEDLLRTFGIEAKRGDRNFSCFLLEPNDNIRNIKSSGGKPSMDLSHDSGTKFLKNQPVQQLQQYLSGILDAPVIFEGSDGLSIDITFPKEFHKLSLQELRLFLKANGFNLVSSNKVLPAIIIYQSDRAL